MTNRDDTGAGAGAGPLGHAFQGHMGLSQVCEAEGLCHYYDDSGPCLQPRSAHEAAPCAPSHCWSPDHHSMDCPARQPAAGGGEAVELRNDMFGLRLVTLYQDRMASERRLDAAHERRKEAEARATRAEQERDAAREYGKDARLRENAAENARITAVDKLARVLGDYEATCKSLERERDALRASHAELLHRVEGAGHTVGCAWLAGPDFDGKSAPCDCGRDALIARAKALQP